MSIARAHRIAGVVLVAALLAACSVSDDDAVGRTSVDPSTAATSTAPTPTTNSSDAATPSPDPTSPAVTKAPITKAPDAPPGPGPLGVDITLPPAGVDATGPAVVLLHGGFWVGGNPDIMDPWAKALAAAGSVVFNASYRLVGQGGGYPGTIDDVACAVRYARAQAAELTTSDQLVIMGHSAGGHLAAVVALNGDAFGADCAYPQAAPPDRLVGLAGLYDIRGLGSLFDVFVGAPRTDRPAAWESVNPAQLADRRDDLSVVLVAGANDPLVRLPEATAFEALLPSEHVTLEVVPGAGHNELMDPAVVGLATLGFG